MRKLRVSFPVQDGPRGTTLPPISSFLRTHAHPVAVGACAALGHRRRYIRGGYEPWDRSIGWLERAAAISRRWLGPSDGSLSGPGDRGERNGGGRDLTY